MECGTFALGPPINPATQTFLAFHRIDEGKSFTAIKNGVSEPLESLDHATLYPVRSPAMPERGVRVQITRNRHMYSLPLEIH